MNLRKLLVTATLMALPVTGFAEGKHMTAFFPVPVEDKHGQKLNVIDRNNISFRLLCSDPKSMEMLSDQLSKPEPASNFFSDEVEAPVTYMIGPDGVVLDPPITVKYVDTQYTYSDVHTVDDIGYLPSFVALPEYFPVMLRARMTLPESVKNHSDVKCGIVYITDKNVASNIYYWVNLPESAFFSWPPSVPSVKAIRQAQIN